MHARHCDVHTGSAALFPDAPPRPKEHVVSSEAAVPDRAPLACVQLLVVTLVVFQRFIVPGSAISIAVPVVFIVLIVLAVRGHIVADLTRTGLYLAAMTACALVSLLSSTGAGVELSLNSLLLLAVVYFPCCWRLAPALRSRFPEVLRFFQHLMVAVAVACIGQWAAQLAGWRYHDLLDFLPSQWLASTVDFNLSYPLYYGSSIYKSNGIVFLEPSFASQFLALAVIVQLLLGGARWRLVLFGGALLTTLSGTGILLLMVGLAVLALRRGGRWAARTVVAITVVVVAVSATPVGSLIGDRSTESAQEGSSGNARFVAPYDNVVTAVSGDARALLVGRGAGSVDRDGDFFSPRGVPANYAAVPKLVGEYGLPAALVFLTFVLTMLLRRIPSITLGVVSCMLYFVLSSSLLEPQIVYLCWLLTGLFSAAAPSSTPKQWALGRTPRPAGRVRGSAPATSSSL